MLHFNFPKKNGDLRIQNLKQKFNEPFKALVDSTA